MRIRCIHGFFLFDETTAGQAADWSNLTGLQLVPKGDYFTFAALAEAPDYSINGKPLLGVPSTKTFEGEPWEVFEANGFVYDFNTGLVGPITAVTQTTQIKQAGNYFIAPSGLILPGSLTDEGNRVKDYLAWFSRQTGRYLYSEVSYV